MGSFTSPTNLVTIILIDIRVAVSFKFKFMFKRSFALTTLKFHVNHTNEKPPRYITFK